jgi:hypothetical protein
MTDYGTETTADDGTYDGTLLEAITAKPEVDKRTT